MVVPDIVHGLVPPMLISFSFITPLLSLIIKSKRFFMVYASLLGLLTSVLSLVIAIDVFREGVVLYPFGGWPPPIGIAYIIDKLNAAIALLAAFIFTLSIISSSVYLRRYQKASTLAYFYTILLAIFTGAMGSLYTGDTFNLFVMMEVMCIGLYTAVAFHRSRAEAVEAAIKYSFVSIIALVLYFFAAVLFYSGFQTLNMADLALKARGNTSGLVSGGFFGNYIADLVFALALTVWVFTLESALVPNHFWLPDAISEAPTPVSAVFPVAESVAVYVIIRYMFTVFGPDSVVAEGRARDTILVILLVLGAIASIVGGIMMAIQRDAKRLLGYSSISHIGFIYMAIGLAFSNSVMHRALTASILHMINYTISSSLLFISLISIESAVGGRNIDDLTGLGRSLPLLGFSITIGVLNLIGIPPLSGFYSKFLIYQAALEASQPIVAVITIVATALTLMGYIKLLYIVFGKPSIGGEKPEKQLAVSIPATVLALLCILLGLSITIGFMNILEEIAASAYSHEQYTEVFYNYMEQLFPR
ncbi:MAG: proton-conducting transporter membrane subunit [Ignisphaera sp.]|nr:cation:proton antiporter [Ignisphaera sp.]MCX8167873.1 proton-conducting transporter membrane subunit [Ignisphaera sp.]MDW8085486.1 proton-conducting transporter membrane subunit [Ignisphaera sp.]